MGRFVYWLWDRQWPEQADQKASQVLENPEAFDDEEGTPGDDMEWSWYWDAPRLRTAKLLWAELQRAAPSKNHKRGMVLYEEELAAGAQYCGAVLPPIIDRLIWVMDSIQSVERLSEAAGQVDGGEVWFLPDEQAQFVNEQLSRATVQLLGQDSDYQRELEYTMNARSREAWGFVPLALQAHDRTYVGQSRRPDADWAFMENYVVHVKANDTQEPLVNARSPWSELPGNGFAWGYGGSGPTDLAMSILADSVDGDLLIPRSYHQSFKNDVIAQLPKDGFALTKQQVLGWLAAAGVSNVDLDVARTELAIRVHAHHREFTRLRSQLEAARSVGGLRKQKFDVVPKDFEAALYVDLMDAQARWPGDAVHGMRPADSLRRQWADEPPTREMDQKRTHIPPTLPTGIQGQGQGRRLEATRSGSKVSRISERASQDSKTRTIATKNSSSAYGRARSDREDEGGWSTCLRLRPTYRGSGLRRSVGAPFLDVGAHTAAS